MNMKSESLSTGKQQEHHPISWVQAEPPPALSHLLGWATRALHQGFARVLSRVLCSKVSFMALLYHHVLLLRSASAWPMGFLKTKRFFSRVIADPLGLVV